jgi:cytochrome c
MDGFEFNKIAGAVLGTALGVMVLSIVSEAIYAPIEAEEPGYVVALATTEEGGGGATQAGPAEPIAVRLQTASVTAGETVAKKCVACHTMLQGQPAKVGPNLFGVVGGGAAHQEGFKYSAAMLQKRTDGWMWTYDTLDEFLTSPKKAIPGTAMSFAGLPKPKDRADVIAYLRTLADNPLPLPAATTAEVAPAPAGAVPAPEHSTPLPPPTPQTPPQ